MRKKALLFSILVFTGTLVCAITLDNHSFSIGTSIGLLYGESQEILYINSNSRIKASQLDWEIKPLFYAGLDLHYSWQPETTNISVFSDIFFKFGFPGITGLMEDRDWFDSSNNSTYPGWLTLYSVHDNYTKGAVFFDINAGAVFKLKYDFVLKVYLSYNLMFFSWEASGGSQLYPAWLGSDSHASIPSSKLVITYTQIWNILSPAVSFYGAFNRYFDIELSFKISPLVWCHAVDGHLLRYMVFTDDVSGGVFVEPGFLFSFTPKSFLSFSVSFAYRYMSGARGDTLVQEWKEPDLSYNNCAGTAYSAVNLGIVAKYIIF